MSLSNEDLRAAKTEFRKRAKHALSLMIQADRERWSGLICDLVIGLPAWTDADEILLYSPMPVEVDTRPLAVAAERAGKPVYLPRLHGNDMVFHLLTRSPLVPHSYGMMEPDPDAPRWPGHDGESALARRVLVICPGLAFDRGGGRLGRGKAFYDRFITSLTGGNMRDSAAVIGVSFGVQLFAEVPAGPLDQRMDGVVSEQGFLDFAGH